MKKMHYTFFLGIIIVITAVSCDNTTKHRFGSPCSGKTVCEGVCNLGLPDGMCTEECSDTVPCRQGKCVDFGENAYCLPDCTTNEDCRAGYSCIDFFCAPLQPVGARCDDDHDCLPCADQAGCLAGSRLECRENVCSVPCSDQADCPAGTMCAYSLDDYWCVGIDYETGPGFVGSDCSVSPCAEGSECVPFVSPDGRFPVCTRTCENDRECPPFMVCRADESGAQRCHPRTLCEPCELSSSCGEAGDLCVGKDPAAVRYCARECDPDLPGSCPADTQCREVRRCESRHAWVLDCAGCEDCDSSEVRHQCVPWNDVCVGGGDFCSGCFVDAQCSEGFSCVLGADAWQRICALPCVWPGEECPDGTGCRETDEGFFCMPRTGACSSPSGGRVMCDVCVQHGDCLRGFCAAVAGDPSGFKYCLDLPQAGVCGPYARPAMVSTAEFGSVDVCVPDTVVTTCAHYQECIGLCPEGPALCAAGPDYCR